MSKQADFMKVKTRVLDPIATLYNRGKPMDEHLAAAFVEDLARFDELTLEKAMREVRQTRMTMPTIAHLIEACRSLSPRSQVAAPPPHASAGIGSHPRVADRVMRSDTGRRAIAAGVAYEVWLRAHRDGKQDFTDADFERYRVGIANAANALREARKLKNPLIATLESCFESMRERDRELEAKYGGAA